MSNEMKKFKLHFNSIPVELELEEGKVRQLELRELSAAGRDAYLNSLHKRTKFDGDGNAKGISDFVKLQADLLGVTLFDKDTKEAVKVEEVQKFPATVVAELYEMAQGLNVLKKKDEPEGKDLKVSD
jgi:hypothetical protein